MKLLLKIAYNGSAYCGYQVQPNGISIQQRLNEAAEALFGFPCDIVGCSRTDSGVHAKEFCATVAKKGMPSIETSIPTERIPLAMSAHLPSDICVFDAKVVPDEFHARYDVKEKEYIYRFFDRAVRDPFEEGRAYHIPKPISNEALTQMNRAAAAFCGTHDFAAFMAQGSKVQSTVRCVTHAEVFREDNAVIFRVAADGFLYNMVRIMAGTLLEVAAGKLSPDEITAILESRDRFRAGHTAPACGLYLNHVIY
jgi:tRNA pseudouridine38-40 synthase